MMRIGFDVSVAPGVYTTPADAVSVVFAGAASFNGAMAVGAAPPVTLWKAPRTTVPPLSMATIHRRNGTPFAAPIGAPFGSVIDNAVLMKRHTGPPFAAVGSRNGIRIGLLLLGAAPLFPVTVMVRAFAATDALSCRLIGVSNPRNGLVNPGMRSPPSLAITGR